jgi:hypothetical protein
VDTRFFRVSLSKARNPTSYSRTLQYPRMLQRALRSGHYLVTDKFGSGERESVSVRTRGESSPRPMPVDLRSPLSALCARGRPLTPVTRVRISLGSPPSESPASARLLLSKAGHPRASGKPGTVPSLNSGMCCAVRCRSAHNGQLLSRGEGLESEFALRLRARSGGRGQRVQQVKHRGRLTCRERGNVNDCAVDEVLRRHRGC